jgi:hypothetical protein
MIKKLIMPRGYNIGFKINLKPRYPAPEYSIKLILRARIAPHCPFVGFAVSRFVVYWHIKTE